MSIILFQNIYSVIERTSGRLYIQFIIIIISEYMCIKHSRIIKAFSDDNYLNHSNLLIST